MRVKIGFISDTHNNHGHGFIGNGKWANGLDIVVHSGDISGIGRFYEVLDFLKWYTSLSADYKILVPGNHDLFFDTDRKVSTNIGLQYHKYGDSASKEEILEMLPTESNFYYLNDSGCEVLGLKFWGSPITPRFNNWAFNRISSINDDGEIYDGPNSIKPHWDKIPNDTDILVTHGPPYKILDKANNLYGTETDYHKGCKYLAKKVEEIKPKVHAFGHIHEAYGRIEKAGTIYINCSYLNSRYQPEGYPHIIEFDI